ncbi:MAG TPA: HAD family hydrolase [Ktedonobacteraceae bacterium]|nr:HAD family hydrolase [Ktedonobacteraceae bacterium]
MNSKLVLFTDIDNTLFDWIDYFAPCFRAMVHALAYTTELEEEEIYRQFKEVYTRFETAEYRHAIQELELYRRETPEMQKRLLEAGFVAFSRARRRRLQAYTTVPSTLHWLKQQGVVIIGVTNSWVVDAVARLRSLGIGKYLDGLIAWDGLQVHGGQPSIPPARSPIRRVVTIPSEYRKPSPEGYRTALISCGIGLQSKLWVIGDSVTNDLAPARELGASTIWAKYGRKYDQLNFETVVRITHWGKELITKTYDSTTLTPDFIIDDFAQLRSIIPKMQEELFPDLASD